MGRVLREAVRVDGNPKPDYVRERKSPNSDYSKGVKDMLMDDSAAAVQGGAPVPARASASVDDPRELDYLYNQADRIYSSFARRCGLSPCAYWMMYEVVQERQAVPVRDLTARWSYSKQTVNSALQTLITKGLCDLDFVEGSKKNKAISLTCEGMRFAERYVMPAIEAERRAFCTLPVEQRALLLEATRAYTLALEEALTVELAGAGIEDEQNEDGAA